jgi:hypothetical protein
MQLMIPGQGHLSISMRRFYYGTVLSYDPLRVNSNVLLRVQHSMHMLHWVEGNDESFDHTKTLSRYGKKIMTLVVKFTFQVFRKRIANNVYIPFVTCDRTCHLCQQFRVGLTVISQSQYEYQYEEPTGRSDTRSQNPKPLSIDHDVCPEGSFADRRFRYHVQHVRGQNKQIQPYRSSRFRQNTIYSNITSSIVVVVVVQ